MATDFSGVNDFASAVAIQADGKIVVVGTTLSSSTNFDFALARYNADGTHDLTFGTGGMVITALPAGWSPAAAIPIDGKVVAGGGSDVVGGGADLRLARTGTLADGVSYPRIASYGGLHEEELTVDGVY